MITSFYSQEPVERKLGETTIQVCKNSNSFVKIKPDLVYDVPLLKSLHQQLRDRHILKEVCQYNHIQLTNQEVTKQTI